MDVRYLSKYWFTALLVIVLGFSPIAASAEQWKALTLDSLNDVGGNTHLNLDSNDRLHITYTGANGTDPLGNPKYVSNSSGRWKIEDLPQFGHGGVASALDSEDRLHIVYTAVVTEGEVTSTKVFYATNSSGKWENQIIDDNGWTCPGSIAVDSDDKVHIAYSNAEESPVYATYESGSWKKVILPWKSTGTTNRCQKVQIILNSDDLPHVMVASVNIETATYYIGYVSMQGTSWVYRIIKEIRPWGGQPGGTGPSMAIDANDNLHIAYDENGRSAYGFMYGNNVEGGWSFSKLETIRFHHQPSIAVDFDGAIHISAQRESDDGFSRNLCYYSNSSGTWKKQELDAVDEQGNKGQWSSLAIDSEGYVHISYLDAGNMNLKYVTNSPNVTGTFILGLITQGTGKGSVSSSDGAINCGRDCTSIYYPGDTVTLTATAGTDSIFEGWSGGGCSGTGPCTVTMDNHKEVTARFARNAFNVSVKKEGTGTGTVWSDPSGIACGKSCSATFIRETALDLFAQPSSSSIFLGWSGSCTGDGDCSLVVDGNTNVGAVFAKVKYEESAPEINYTGAWTLVKGKRYSGFRIKKSNETGSFASFTFDGTKITWYAAKRANAGIATVKVDGNEVDVDLYSPTPRYKRGVWSKTWGDAGPHTVIIETKGAKNASSTGTDVNLDFFKVVP